MGRICINDHRPEHSLGNPAWRNGCAQCEIERLRAELAEWGRLRDPAVLAANLLRGQPATLPRESLLHLAGAQQLLDAAVAAERERCARLCESAPERYDITGGAAEVARALAKEIRASAPATDPEPPA